MPGEGSATAAVVLVGEAPGAKEDETGRPFVGAAGRLLDDLLAEAGLERADVFITNVVKARPPGNRDPKADEVAHHLPWLEAQLEVIRAEAARPARPPRARALRPRREDHRRRTGRSSSATAGRLFPMYHPAAALRNPRLRDTLARGRAGAARRAVSPGPVRIGCSGWQYRDWRGVLYPEGVGQARWLERYAEVFDTVEVNATFYRLRLAERGRALGGADAAGLPLRAEGQPLPHPHEAAARHRAGRRALLRAHRAARAHPEDGARSSGSCRSGSGATTTRSPPRSTLCRRAATASSSAIRAGSATRSTSCCAGMTSRSRSATIPSARGSRSS